MYKNEENPVFTIVDFVLTSINYEASARRKIEMSQGGQVPTHIEYYPPADMPEVYIDLDEMEVIIEADGFADYYVVNIISQATMQSVIYTQISGYGDTVDVSSLPDGYYRLVITSSNNNVFEGYFTIEWRNDRIPSMKWTFFEVFSHY